MVGVTPDSCGETHEQIKNMLVYALKQPTREEMCSILEVALGDLERHIEIDGCVMSEHSLLLVREALSLGKTL